jgi:hypothetical protein
MDEAESSKATEVDQGTEPKALETIGEERNDARVQ